MQQAAALQVGRLAEVERLRRLRGIGREPQPLLEPVEVLLQAGRTASPPAPRRARSPTIELAADQPHRRLVAEAEDGARRLVQVGEVRQRPAAQRRQRLGQPDRLDHRGRRGIEPLLAQQPGHPGQPALDHLIRGGPEVIDTSPATRSPHRSRSRARAGRTSTAPRSRRPSSWGVPSTSAASSLAGRPAPRRRAPGRARRRRPRRSRGVPRACAARIVCRMWASRRSSRRSSSAATLGADLGHRVEDRGEEVGAVATVLDDELPPALAVVEARPPRRASRADRRGAAGEAAARPRTAGVGVLASSSLASPIWWATGRSMNRAGMPRSSAYWSACHSGENSANG